MAIVSVIEIAEGNRGEVDYRGVRKYTRVFQVLVDNDADGPMTVSTHASIPTRGLPYVASTESDDGAFVKMIRPERSTKDRRVWTVTVEYDSAADSSADGGGGSGSPGSPGANPASRPENPLLRPVEWSLDWIEETRAFQADLDGKIYANSAGLLFSPPRTRVVCLPVITAIKNYASFDYVDANAYFDKVNLEEWQGFGVETVKSRVKLKSAYEGGFGFVRAEWTFTVNRNPDYADKWTVTPLLDKGPFYIDNVTGKKRYFAGPMHESNEGLLDGGGGALAEGAPEQYVTFREYDKVTFVGVP